MKNKYDKLTVIGDIKKDSNNRKIVEVQCSCENKTIFTVRVDSLINGKTT